VTTVVVSVVLVLIARALLEACSETRKPGYDFLALMNAGVLPVSKKAGARTPSTKKRKRRR
jgi:hypothetical protein